SGSLGCTTCFTSLTIVPTRAPSPCLAMDPVALEATEAPENASSALSTCVEAAVSASAWTTVPVLYALNTALENGIGPAANDEAARPLQPWPVRAPRSWVP